MVDGTPPTPGTILLPKRQAIRKAGDGTQTPRTIGPSLLRTGGTKDHFVPRVTRQEATHIMFTSFVNISKNGLLMALLVMSHVDRGVTKDLKTVPKVQELRSPRLPVRAVRTREVKAQGEQAWLISASPHLSMNLTGRVPVHATLRHLP